MAKAKKVSPAKKEKAVSKKMYRQQIESRMEQMFSEVKQAIGEKKFKRRIRKAGKAITAGLSKTFLTDSIEKKKTDRLQRGDTDTLPISNLP